jgi:hypothetical protein
VVKVMNVLAEYRQLYLAGWLHVLALGAFVLGMCFLLLFDWEFGFFG